MPAGKKAKRRKPTHYRLMPGFSLKGNVTLIGKTLEALRKDHGGFVEGVQPIIDHGKGLKSAFHNEFTWDVNDAAQERWEEQARYILRAVIAEEMPAEADGKIEGRGFEWVTVKDPVTEKPKRAWTAMITVMTDKDLRKQRTDLALDELRRWRIRYYRYKELAQICKALKQYL